MKGDFTRDTFDPEKHYTAVLQQQGRVQLDADWNEQQAITRHRIETEARDIIGPHGGPQGEAGFEISFRRIENGSPMLEINAGRYYVDGNLCLNRFETPYDSQPDYPLAPPLLDILSSNPPGLFVFLDVWQRHVTALDDPGIRDVALGGADTATRLKTIWQVRVLPYEASATTISCASPPRAYQSLRRLYQPRLAARIVLGEPSQDPCVMPPSAGYRRLENQLYRVEIHEPGDLGVATFKWSRDNGTVVTAIAAHRMLDGGEGNDTHSGADGTDSVFVRELGRDHALGFRIGDLVEISDDRTELHGERGVLGTISDIEAIAGHLRLRLTELSEEISFYPEYHPKLRRWDGHGEVQTGAAADSWVDLEDGIQIQFSGSGFRTGDYWLIPARTATGDIDWPEGPNRFLPPRGIQHHYCPLATISLPSTGDPAVSDCRALFPPLRERPSLVPEAIHITHTDWANDRAYPPDKFFDGLRVQFDSPIHLMTSHAWAVCIEAPEAGNHSFLKTLMFIDGRVESPNKDSAILEYRWRPVDRGSTVEYINEILARGNIDRVRVRVTLKGALISGRRAGDERIWLDGQALGQGNESEDRVELLLPSGIGVRASDFESWFYIEEPIVLEALVLERLDEQAISPGEDGQKPASKKTRDQSATLHGVVRLDRTVSRRVSVNLSWSTTDEGRPEISNGSREIFVEVNQSESRFSLPVSPGPESGNDPGFTLTVVATLDSQRREDSVFFGYLL